MGLSGICFVIGEFVIAIPKDHNNYIFTYTTGTVSLPQATCFYPFKFHRLECEYVCVHMPRHGFGYRKCRSSPWITHSDLDERMEERQHLMKTTKRQVRTRCIWDLVWLRSCR